MEFDLRLKDEPVPYNLSPVCLGITFDEKVAHPANLTLRALKRHEHNKNIFTSTTIVAISFACLLILKMTAFCFKIGFLKKNLNFTLDNS